LAQLGLNVTRFPFWRAARRYRTIQIRAGQHIMTAEDPLPADLREVLALIKRPGGAH
jgi:hypothetical protein